MILEKNTELKDIHILFYRASQTCSTHSVALKGITTVKLHPFVQGSKLFAVPLADNQQDMGADDGVAFNFAGPANAQFLVGFTKQVILASQKVEKTGGHVPTNAEKTLVDELWKRLRVVVFVIGPVIPTLLELPAMPTLSEKDVIRAIATEIQTVTDLFQQSTIPVFQQKYANLVLHVAFWASAFSNSGTYMRNVKLPEGSPVPTATTVYEKVGRVDKWPIVSDPQVAKKFKLRMKGAAAGALQC